MLKITFPDNSVKEFKKGSTPLDIANSISPSLAKQVIAAKVDDLLVDANCPIQKDCKIVLLTPKSDESFAILNHSTAHLMANAVLNLYPKAQLSIGPSIAEGFYYDIDFGDEKFSDEALPFVLKEMKKLSDANLPISRHEISLKDAKIKFGKNPYKLDIIEEHKDEVLTYYKQGEFEDLCAGPHVLSTGKMKHFTLLSIAGAYFKGDSKNKVLTRIYGTSHFSKESLEAYLVLLEERKQRDHRKLGKELGIFIISPEAGSGLPFWLPHGATVRRVIERYITDKEIELGYLHVYTPIMANTELYKQSGHWDHYHEDMFPPMDMGDGEFLVLRPMNCPHHMLIYKNELRSYRDLPIRIAELGMMHRYEKSGALSGLQRVREMTLNDGHIFVRPDQIKEEFVRCVNLIVEIYEVFGIKDYTFRLSYHDPNNKEKYFDDPKMWAKAEKMLKETLDEMKLDYVEGFGEAAFYGPKLDVQVKTALGHEETLSTVQLDFLLPEKFDLTYVGADGKNNHRPVVIHRGIVSTMERFVAYLLEEYKGALPFWLSPVQLILIPVNVEIHQDYVSKIAKLLKAKGYRVETDFRDEKLGYKIREANRRKIPYQLVLGDNEKANKLVNVRKFGSAETKELSVDELIKVLADEKI